MRTKLHDKLHGYEMPKDVILLDEMTAALPADLAGRAADSEWVDKVITTVGLADRVTHRPNELSGGQQQRVAIARALVSDPAILMADEPTGNLDSRTGRSILDLFDTLHADGLTVIMVTHDDSVAERCQRVVRLADGLVESDLSGGGAS